MEFLSRNSGVKRHTSFSFLFGSQKSPFAFQQGQPTRYYDFVDTPATYKPSPPLIERQNISSEVEGKIREACSLLVYRVEQGIPSGPSKRSRGMTTSSDPQDSSTTAQLNSKYIAPKVGRDVAALKDKHDSGVVLTQQSSMQTMRAKPSQSKSDNTGFGRTTTSNPAQLSSVPPSRGSIQRHESGAEQDTEVKDQTKAFLDGSESKPSPGEDNVAPEDDVEVFLDPDAMVISSGVSSLQAIRSNTSLSVDASSHRQSTITCPSDSLTSLSEPMLSGTSINENKNQPGIIIDKSGIAHVMTAAEESERNMNLQQAVFAKMRTGAIANASSPHLPPSGDSSQEYQTSGIWPGSNASRLKTSWSTMSKAKRNPRGATDMSSEPTVFRKLVNFFSKRRPANVVAPMRT
ncbi:hypothetical protein BO71DRAFT_425636 [Aspergillus ellipticus CBS 707.79]|uniref:Uncharacterized protein n=1 Tax=Aspergillus ellipticus CBS 707.79 TaxID=1448320 RepID=A0A319DNL4_9EURO|nr:hypothetical protein BO71DRAFT_425636 [Aspergillus ellipticus CBS 707.79]